jgi:hypothetical protein
MTAPVIPRLRVDGPPAPVRHRFRLATAATVLDNVEPHALTGVEYETVCSVQVDPYPAACRPGDTTSRVKNPTQTTSVVNGTPFGVYAADACVLGRDQTTARQQLRARFAGGEWTAVERIVFSGEMDNQPNLQKEATVLAGSPVDLVDAVGRLEQWLAEHYGGTGVLHAPLYVAPRAQSLYQVGVNGPRATSILGSSWAFGAGYPGLPPAAAEGEDTGVAWLYATPPVTVRRSGLIEPGDWDTGAFDRATNTGLLIDERLYVVDWPCGAAAVATTVTRPA